METIMAGKDEKRTESKNPEEATPPKKGSARAQETPDAATEAKTPAPAPRKNEPEPQVRLFVRGMHCPACEALVAERIGELPGVRHVRASLAEGTVTVTLAKPEHATVSGTRESGGASPQDPPETRASQALSPEKLGELFADQGYLFAETPFDDAGGRLREFALAGGAVLLAAAFFLFLEHSGILHLVLVDTSSALPAFVLFGLLAGISSCAALVGGLVLSVSRSWGTDGNGKSCLSFNLGRLVAYGAAGALLGSLGSAFRISAPAAALLVFAVSFVMAALGLQMLGVPGAERLRLPFSGEGTSRKGKGTRAPFLLGASTVFLPCGFSITVQGVALLSGDPFRGALVMLAFALGTAPSLLAIGIAGTRFLSHPRFSRLAGRIAGALVLMAALYNVNAQLNVLSMPSLSDLPFFRTAPEQASAVPLAPEAPATPRETPASRFPNDAGITGSTCCTVEPEAPAPSPPSGRFPSDAGFGGACCSVAEPGAASQDSSCCTAGAAPDGSPITGQPAPTGAPLRSETPPPQAAQRIIMAAGARSYTPNVFQVKAGVPVRWEITDGGFSGCTNAVMARGLFNGTLPLVRGGTAVAEFTPEKPGHYKFSCWMGMVSGIIEVLP
jgi:sulfite exporter TauE/SafE/copper chaperone CopZ/plastocyanin